MIEQHFLGVDIAGFHNTWLCHLSWDGQNLKVNLPFVEGNLAAIKSYCQKFDFTACAIDAPISFSPRHRWRASDKRLKELLPNKGKNACVQCFVNLWKFLTSSELFKTLGQESLFIKAPSRPLVNHPHPDGVIDALVCALTSFIYIKAYHLLKRLPSDDDLRGFAPFYVIYP